MADRKPLLSSGPSLNYTGAKSTHTIERQLVHLQFDKICAYARNTKILLNVSGDFKPGSLTAIIGTSGAGKTTLLNILAGHQTETQGFKVTGTVLVNGVPRKMKIFRKHSAFIEQSDILLATHTPQEALEFSAHLRLSRDMPERGKMFIVQNLMDQLGLTKARDVITGHPEGEKGLSGGQRKRLSIALELVAEPSLLFLDEPTSGLDSTTSLQLGKLLRQLADTGRTVICTVHQPSSSLFHLFDNVIVMSAGEIAYTGPTKSVVNALAAVGLECPPYENPAEWILTMALDPQASMFLVDSNLQKKGESKEMPPPLEYRKNNVSTFSKFKLILRRSVVSTLRDRTLTRARMGAHIFMGILIGFLYFKQDINQTSIDNRLAYCFFSLIFLMLVALMPTVLTFPVEKAIFKRELQNNWYNVGVYYAAKSFADFPLQVLPPAIYGTITFFMINVYSHHNPDFVAVYFKVMLAFVAQVLVSQAMGIVVGIAAPSLQTGIFASPMIAIPNLLFCGFLIKLPDISVGLRWLQYVVYIRYTLQALALEVFDKATFHCRDNEYVNPGPNQICPVTNGHQVIVELDYQHLSYWECIGILFGYFILLRLIGFIILRVQHRKVR